MANHTKLPPSAIHAALLYDPSDGSFTWKQSRGAAAKGSKAGTVNADGYIVIGLLKTTVTGHRLAWFMHFGMWPELPLDHINGVRTDNRIANLREVPQLLNTQNRRQANAGSRSGLLGASWKSKLGRWVAQIRHDGKLKHLGYFATAEEAHGAYLEAKRRLHAGSVL